MIHLIEEWRTRENLIDWFNLVYQDLLGITQNFGFNSNNKDDNHDKDKGKTKITQCDSNDNGQKL